MDAILAELGDAGADPAAVLVNGLGATPLSELYVLNRRVRQRLDALGIAVHATWVGNYCTSLEMAGASVTLIRLDAELIGLLDHPASCPALRVG
jgi:dihydroxyacetone kinase-like protein